MDNAIGLKVKIDYFDHNEDFRKILPRTGKISRRLTGKNGATDWFLVVLDIPFEYQIKVGETLQFRSLHCKEILIRSRWEGCEIKGAKETSVFILLIPPEILIKDGPVDTDALYHVAWGVCSVVI